MCKQASNDPAALLKAIRARCLDCMGGNREQVARCNCVRCSLHPHRMGAEEAGRYHDSTDGGRGMQLSLLDGMGCLA